MKKTWEVLKKWGLAIAAGLLFLLGAGWAWRRKQAKLGALKDELAVARALEERNVLKAKREEIAARRGEVAAEVVALDEMIAQSTREIVDAYEGGSEIPDEELEDAFASLGY